VWFQPVDSGAHAAEYVPHLLDIADVRDVAEKTLFRRQERGGHRAHSRVLGAADLYCAFESVSALDNQ
jgi:hypothetical protein